ncbi:hypothetical protein DET1073 [Dehalococcoides mccartyi 195]|uniref:Uncharacterized protein n=1 Tax=Dehalococcoides mccartyi (strain ATCC BAA-2266 / KCTC 15142 / 195) TaxID=243164 RepID=Q3Z7L1_DEHM1|nr:hypothetical protein DET1073 [Dehalococcoides mccartyi 195]
MDAKGAVFSDHGDGCLLLGEYADRDAEGEKAFDALDIFLVGFRIVAPEGNVKAGIIAVILPRSGIDAINVRNQSRPLQELFRIGRIKVIWDFKLYHASSVSVSV